jgi:hypothetical protein
MLLLTHLMSKVWEMIERRYILDNAEKLGLNLHFSTLLLNVTYFGIEMFHVTLGKAPPERECHLDA